MLASDSLTEKTSWCLQILYSQWLFFSSSLRESATAKKGFSFLLEQLPVPLSSSSISNVFPFLFCFVWFCFVDPPIQAFHLNLSSPQFLFQLLRLRFFEVVMSWNFNEEMDSIDICPMPTINRIPEVWRHLWRSSSPNHLFGAGSTEIYIFGCISLSGTGVGCGLSAPVWPQKNLLMLSKPVCLCTAPQAAVQMWPETKGVG